MTFYDVEGDYNGDGVCSPGECENLVISASESDDYSFVGDDIIVMTQHFFGTLELGIQIYDGEITSDPLFIYIPVEGVNDYPSIIDGMEVVYFEEDFGEISYDLGNIFTDVDGDELSYEIVGEVGDLFGAEISDILATDLMMNSNQDISGQVLYFNVSDGTVSIDNQQITFVVSALDDPPIAVDVEFSTDEDESVLLFLQAQMLTLIFLLLKLLKMVIQLMEPWGRLLLMNQIQA